MSAVNDKGDQNFKRKLSKREKKELKKKEKLSRLKSDTNDENRPVAEKLYTGNFAFLRKKVTKKNYAAAEVASQLSSSVSILRLDCGFIRFSYLIFE